MKSRELRIGSIIDFEGLLCEVQEFDTSGAVVYIPETGESEWIDIFQFSPYPITDDILVRCGFIEASPSIFELETFWISKHEGKYFYTSTVKNIELEGLHSLQNLYMVMEGKELTIADDLRDFKE